MRKMLRRFSILTSNRRGYKMVPKDDAQIATRPDEPSTESENDANPSKAGRWLVLRRDR